MECVVILVGNKVDLESQRAVDAEIVKKWAATNKMTYIETSAKTGKGVSEVFTTLTEKMLEQREKKKKAQNIQPPSPAPASTTFFISKTCYFSFHSFRYSLFHSFVHFCF